MNYSKFIDHTCLKQDATKSQIITLCKDAIEYDFMSVCVNPSYVPLAYSLLKDSSVKVCTVVGFPLGMTSTCSKIKETEIALRDGASEIDMVINVGRLKDKDNDYVLNEIRKIKEVCGSNILKVIIETCLLTDEEIVRVCNLAKEAKADFVKTSTGFSTSGATIHAVKLMRETVGKNMGVKASGGIKTKEDMLLMIEAGASRIGTSNGVAIIKNIK